MGDGNEPDAAPGEGLFERGEVERVVGVDADHIERDALRCKRSPGKEVRVVLEDGGHHAVARLPGEATRNHVDRVRGVLRKDRDPDLSADEPGHLLVGMPVALRRDPGQAVDAPSDVGPVAVLELDERLHHRFRRKTRRCVVQIDDVAEDREILPDILRGEFFFCRQCRTLGFDCLHTCRLGRFLCDRSLTEGEVLVHADAPLPADLAHLRGQRPPPPEPPTVVGVRQAVLLRPGYKEFVPAPRQFRVHLPETLILALKRRRAEVTADPFEALLIERVYGGLAPPEVEEDLERPPVPDRRDVQLQGVCGVLARLVEVGPVPGLVPAVPLDGDAGAGPGKVDLQGVEFQEFAAPAAVLPRRPRLLDRLEEVAALPDDLDALRRHERHGLGEFQPGIDEERLLHPGLSCKVEGGGAVFAAGKRDVHARPVVHVLLDGTNRVSLKVL